MWQGKRIVRAQNRFALIARLLLILCTLLSAGACRPHPKKPPVELLGLSRPEPDALYVQLRERVLTGSAADFKVEPGTNSFTLWGVVIEHGLPNGTATLVCFANGEATLYLSSGAGLAGTSSNAAIRASASNLVVAAAQHLSAVSPTESWPTPGIGQVAFWFLSTNQVLGTHVARADLENENHPHPLTKLYRSANALLSEMHLVGAEIRTKAEAEMTAAPTNSPNNE